MHFLCADFDDKSCEHGLKNDLLAYVNVCKGWNIPCYIERSRLVNGTHAWIFFEDSIEAVKARRLGNVILTYAMEYNGKMTFKSYNRLFPNQERIFIKKSLSLYLAIIYKSVAWYGSVNYLGHNAGDDHAIKLFNRVLANKVTEVLYE